MKLFILPALIGSLFASSALAQNGGTQIEYKSFPLTLADSNGHYLAELDVNGKKGNFIVDSGCATYFVTAKKFADAAKIDLTESGEAETVVGRTKRYSGEISELKFGSVKKLGKLKTSVTDFGSQSGLKVKGREVAVDGLVGGPLMKALRVTLDYKNSKILFAPKEARKNFYASQRQKSGDVLVKLSEGPGAAPYVPVTMNGEKFLFLVDSGASENLLTNASAKLLGVSSRQVKGKTKVVTIKKPVLGRLQLPELKFLVRDSVKVGGIKAEGYTFGGIIGSEILSSLNASLDYDSFTLIFDKSVKSQ